MTDPAPDLHDAAARIGLEVPEPCVPGVEEALAGIAMHLQRVERALDEIGA